MPSPIRHYDMVAGVSQCGDIFDHWHQLAPTHRVYSSADTVVNIYEGHALVPMFTDAFALFLYLKY